MVRQKIDKLCAAALIKEHPGTRVPRIDLGQELAASPARSKNGILRHSHNRFDLGFPCLDHLRGRCVLGTEANSATQVDADADVDLPCHGSNRRSYRGSIMIGAAQSHGSHMRSGCRDQGFLARVHVSFDGNRRRPAPVRERVFGCGLKFEWLWWTERAVGQVSGLPPGSALILNTDSPCPVSGHGITQRRVDCLRLRRQRQDQDPQSAPPLHP